MIKYYTHHSINRLNFKKGLTMINKKILTKMKKVQNLIQYNKHNYTDEATFYKHSIKLSTVYNSLALKLYN